ncbi:MAG: hypothetical protein M0C28_31145 [Candidatus Moduliflexus flocculans]|nr:hypothetical protein [Candidatus Moduliflexus flocculans]
MASTRARAVCSLVGVEGAVCAAAAPAQTMSADSQDGAAQRAHWTTLCAAHRDERPGSGPARSCPLPDDERSHGRRHAEHGQEDGRLGRHAVTRAGHADPHVQASAQQPQPDEDLCATGRTQAPSVTEQQTG